MDFAWNEDKAASNLAKHGVAFEEAATIFEDPYFIEFFDPDHSDGRGSFHHAWHVQQTTFVGCFAYRKKRFGTPDQRPRSFEAREGNL